jgi:hypothetical protein
VIVSLANRPKFLAKQVTHEVHQTSPLSPKIDNQ